MARCRFPKETANYGGGKELRHLGVDFPRAAPRFLQNGLRGVAFSSNELRHLGPRPRWFHGPTTVKPLGLWGDPGGFHGPPTVKPLGLWGDPGGFTVGGPTTPTVSRSGDRGRPFPRLPQPWFKMRSPGTPNHSLGTTRTCYLFLSFSFPGLFPFLFLYFSFTFTFPVLFLYLFLSFSLSFYFPISSTQTHAVR